MPTVADVASLPAVAWGIVRSHRTAAACGIGKPFAVAAQGSWRNDSASARDSEALRAVAQGWRHG